MHREGGDGETYNFWDRQTQGGTYRGGAHLKNLYRSSYWQAYNLINITYLPR